MTEGPKSKDISSMFADEQTLAWMEQHVTELRQSVSGQSLLYTSLATCFVVGLAAHVGGYALLLSTPKEPLALFADLLHALGWSLWTGVVVVIFTQIIPEAKRRQIKRAIDAYEALERDKAQPNSKR